MKVVGMPERFPGFLRRSDATDPDANGWDDSISVAE